MSEDIAKSVGYSYFEYGDIEAVIIACQGFGKDDRSLRAWARMFSETDGVIIPAYDQHGNPAMPEIKPLIDVEIGPAKLHYHGKIGPRWVMEDLLVLTPERVTAAYCIVKAPIPPKKVLCSDGEMREKNTKKVFDERKKLVFIHSHEMLNPEERAHHLTTFHGVRVEEDDVHGHALACYKASSFAVGEHVKKTKKEDVGEAKEYYTPGLT